MLPLFLRACLEAAFGDKKWQFFVETRRLFAAHTGGTGKKSNAVSAKKGRFLARKVTSKQALKFMLIPVGSPLINRAGALERGKQNKTYENHPSIFTFCSWLLYPLRPTHGRGVHHWCPVRIQPGERTFQPVGDRRQRRCLYAPCPSAHL